MENFKQKLVDNMDDYLFFFKYLLYGKYGIITSKQFIKRVLFLDLMILIALLLFNVFIMYCFGHTKLNGFGNLSLLVFLTSLLAFVVVLALNFTVDSELNRKEGSSVYKIYFVMRILAVSINFLYLTVCFAVTVFLKYIDNVNLEDDIKLSIINSFELLPFTLNVLIGICSVALLLGYLALSHQFYWSTLLDQSWCTSNMIFKEKRAQEILNKAEAID